MGVTVAAAARVSGVDDMSSAGKGLEICFMKMSPFLFVQCSHLFYQFPAEMSRVSQYCNISNSSPSVEAWSLRVQDISSYYN